MGAVSLDTRLLLDTHAVVFWHRREIMSVPTQTLLDHAAARGNLFISSVSFWEVALLARKGRIAIDDVAAWKNDILEFSGARLASADVDAMIASAELPQHHKDPFDRVLVVQARSLDAVLVSRNRELSAYGIRVSWDL
jgi:PIN domain nuclease of toxin-antitoxin system